MTYNHPIGSIYHLYTTYIPCQLGDSMVTDPTYFFWNQETPLIVDVFSLGTYDADLHFLGGKVLMYDLGRSCHSQ